MDTAVIRFDFVVIGAGPAGGSAALELVRARPGVSVALIGDEPHAPYERPPLSKATLRQPTSAPALLFGPLGSLRDAGIETFVPDFAIGIDREKKTVSLKSGRCAGYGKLLIATGSLPRRLTVPGSDLQGVHYLRTHEDAVSLAAALGAGTRVVVIGGGFIGLEVAATARQSGCRVMVLESGARVLGRVAPGVVADAVLRKFTSQGVEVALNAGVVAIHGETRVTAVETADGRIWQADVVAVGVGGVPNDALALACGLRVDHGVTTDARGRASDPDCYAVGDVARREQGLDTHPAYTSRLEAWEPAIEQGVAVAREMLGLESDVLRAPWVWSNQFDWNLQFAGHGDLADTTVVRPGKDPDSFTVFQLWQGRLVGIVTVNDGRNMGHGRRALQGRANLDPKVLASPDVPMKEALRTSRSV